MAPVQQAVVSPIREVPRSIARPPYVGNPGPDHYTGSHVQSADTIERMRVAGDWPPRPCTPSGGDRARV